MCESAEYRIQAKDLGVIHASKYLGMTPPPPLLRLPNLYRHITTTVSFFHLVHFIHPVSQSVSQPAMARASSMTSKSHDVESPPPTPTPPVLLDKQASLKSTHPYHPKMVFKTAKSLFSSSLYCSTRKYNPYQRKRQHHQCCDHSIEKTTRRDQDIDSDQFSSSKETLQADPMSTTSPPASPPRFRSSAGYGATTCLPENPKSPPLSPGGTPLTRIGSSSSGSAANGRNSRPTSDRTTTTRAKDQQPPTSSAERGRNSNPGPQPTFQARPSTPVVSNPTTIGSFSDTIRPVPVHGIHNPQTRLPKPTPGREHQDPRAAPTPGPSAGNIGGQMLGRFSRGEAHKGADASRVVAWKKEEIEERRTEERIEESHRDRWNKYLQDREERDRSREAHGHAQSQQDHAAGSSSKRVNNKRSKGKPSHNCTVS